jgi:hypothetical protein
MGLRLYALGRAHRTTPPHCCSTFSRWCLFAHRAPRTVTPCARLLSSHASFQCTPLGCYNGYDTRRDTRRCRWWRRDEACVVRVPPACGCVGDPFLWHGPVSHRPPAMLGGLPSHQPSSSHHAAPLPAGETAVGNGRASPLCGFQDLPAPRRSQACACGDTTLGVWRHASLERRTLMRLKRWALLGVLQRASKS